MSGSDVEYATVEGPSTAGLARTGRELAERKALHSRLQAEKARIQLEISSYPTPIAGCDEQFNYLLERRTQVRRELAVLEAVEQAGFGRCQSAETVGTRAVLHGDDR